MSATDPRIEAWLAGRLPADQVAELRRALADPAIAEEMVRAANDLVALRTALRGQDANVLAAPAAGSHRGPRRSHPRRPPARRVPWIVLALAAAVLVAVALWVMRADDAPKPSAPTTSWQVVTVEPNVVGGTAPVRVGDPLAPGTAFTASGPQALRLRHDAAAIDVTMDGPFALRVVDDRTLRCRRGSLAARVGARSAGTPFVVDTPHARCSVHGTRFAITVTNEETRLAVSEGRVAFQRRLVDGDLAPQRLITAGASVSSAEPGTDPPPLLAYRLHRGPGSLVGSGLLDAILPLTLRRPPQWTDRGLLLDARNHCVTETNASWPEFRQALVASRAVTLSVRVRCRHVPHPNLLLAVLYIRMADEGERRLICVRMVDGQPGDWERWSVTVASDGVVRTYRDGELVRRDEHGNWPPQPGDPSIQVKLLMPLGHHGEPDPDLAVEYADVLVFDRALDDEELRRLDR